VGALLAVAALLAACGPSGGNPEPDAGLDASAPDARPDAVVWPDQYIPPDAAPPECGNGVVEQGERCDDGNIVSGDGCNSTCTLNDQWDQVATQFTAGDQKEPALTCDATGVIAVFSDWSGVDGDGAGIRMRRFGSDGLPRNNFEGNDEEITVNLEVAGHQRQPRVALLANGNVVVVWTDDSGAHGAGPDVRGRVLAPDGSPVGTEITLTADHTGEQATPAVAAVPAGGFLAVWVGPDPDGFGIRGRLFDDLGLPRTNSQTSDDGSFSINQVVTGAQIQPDVAWIGSGFLVVWTDGSGQLDGDSYGIAGTLLDSGGAFAGPGSDFRINETTAGLQASPRVGHQPGVGAVVVWTDDSQAQDLAHYGVRGRLLDASGVPRVNGQDLSDGDFQVNTTFAADQLLPAPAVLDDGRFAVIWQDWSTTDGSGASVRARLFTPTASPVATVYSPVGDDYQVNTTFWDAQLAPALCETRGWFFALWEDESGQSPDEEGSALRYRLLPGP
jgi:cysteine-rich repeat protein